MTAKHGGFGEPYCSDRCWNKGNGDIGRSVFTGISGVCGFCQRPVHATIGSDVKLIPYRNSFLFICPACVNRGTDFVGQISECCECGKPLFAVAGMSATGVHIKQSAQEVGKNVVPATASGLIKHPPVQPASAQRQQPEPHTQRLHPSMPDGSPTLGIQFDRGRIGSGSYKEECWKILWRLVGPEEMAGAELYECDSNEAMPAGQSSFCIAVRGGPAGLQATLKRACRICEEYKKVCATPMFLDGSRCTNLPLVSAGRLDNSGKLVGDAAHARPALEAVHGKRQQVAHRQQLINNCLQFNSGLIDDYQQEQKQIDLLVAEGPGAIPDIVRAIDHQLVESKSIDSISLIHNAAELCESIGKIGGREAITALSALLPKLAQDVDLASIHERAMKVLLALRNEQSQPRDSPWKKARDLGCLAMAEAFVNTSGWEKAASVKEFCSTINNSPSQPAQAHGAWITVAEAAWGNAENRRLAAQCYLEALRHDPSVESVAWSNLLWEARADLSGLPMEIKAELKETVQWCGPRAVDSKEAMAARRHLLAEVQRCVGLPGDPGPAAQPEQQAKPLPQKLDQKSKGVQAGLQPAAADGNGTSPGNAVAAQPIWYVARGKHKLGPFSLSQLKEKASTDEIKPGDMVLPLGEKKWSRADSISGVFLAAARAPAKEEQWYYSLNKHKIGPVSLSMLKELAKNDLLRAGDMVLKEGTKKWTSADAIDGLFLSKAPAPPIVAALVAAAKAPESRKVEAPVAPAKEAAEPAKDCVCDICSAPLARANMTIVPAARITSATRAGFLPRNIATHSLNRSLSQVFGLPSSSDVEIWQSTVAHNQTADWGLCADCAGELAAFRHGAPSARSGQAEIGQPSRVASVAGGKDPDSAVDQKAKRPLIRTTCLVWLLASAAVFTVQYAICMLFGLGSIAFGHPFPWPSSNLAIVMATIGFLLGFPAVLIVYEAEGWLPCQCVPQHHSEDPITVCPQCGAILDVFPLLIWITVSLIVAGPLIGNLLVYPNSWHSVVSYWGILLGSIMLMILTGVYLIERQNWLRKSRKLEIRNIIAANAGALPHNMAAFDFGNVPCGICGRPSGLRPSLAADPIKVKDISQTLGMLGGALDICGDILGQGHKEIREARVGLQKAKHGVEEIAGKPAATCSTCQIVLCHACAGASSRKCKRCGNELHKW